jgi:hypothetical protein
MTDKSGVTPEQLRDLETAELRLPVPAQDEADLDDEPAEPVHDSDELPNILNSLHGCA